MRNLVGKIMQIKGAGIAIACCILSEAPSVKNFKNAKQFAAFFGVTPQIFESGSSVKKLHMFPKSDQNAQGKYFIWLLFR
ncbi:MAG: IS110 family transposase, partial [Holosporaceae bacterium]|jgi:transposase|nr:IS110 family transposase [Holosporaceae bacterium]